MSQIEVIGIPGAEENIRAAFAKVIGQRDAKAALINSALARLHGGEVSSPLLIAPAGCGKTALMEAYGAALSSVDMNTIITQPETFRKSDSAEWSQVKSLIDSDSNGNYYLGIDEAQQLYCPKTRTVQTARIAAFVMRALDGNFRGGTLALSEDMIAYFCRRRCSVALATNYPGRLPEALRSRAEKIELSLYTEGELIDILSGMLASYNLHARDESILGIIARCGRGTARPMEQIARRLRQNLDAAGATKSTVSKEDIMHALKSLQMFPRGLSKVEMQILDALQTPTVQRVIMARFPNLDVKTWRESSAYLLAPINTKGHTLLTFDRGQYKTTDVAKRWLAEKKAEGFRW